VLFSDNVLIRRSSNHNRNPNPGYASEFNIVFIAVMLIFYQYFMHCMLHVDLSRFRKPLLITGRVAP